MNNLLVTLKRPRNAILAVVVVVLIAAIVVGTLPPRKSGKTQKSSNASTTSNTAPIHYSKELKAKDAQKVTAMYDMISRIIYTYTTSHLNYPTGDADGWADILKNAETTSSFVDPYTNTFYSFTASTPDYGQIQYKPGAACDTKTNTFKTGTYRAIALRTKLYKGVQCVSSVEVQAKQSGNTVD